MCELWLAFRPFAQRFAAHPVVGRPTGAAWRGAAPQALRSCPGQLGGSKVGVF